MKNVQANHRRSASFAAAAIFSGQLVSEAWADPARVFARFGIQAIQPGENDSKPGGGEPHADARQCAGLVRQHTDEIDGVFVLLPNFGDEKGVADTLKLANLNVQVLITGYPDDLKQLSPDRHRAARRRRAQGWPRLRTRFHRGGRGGQAGCAQGMKINSKRRKIPGANNQRSSHAQPRQRGDARSALGFNSQPQCCVIEVSLEPRC